MTIISVSSTMEILPGTYLLEIDSMRRLATRSADPVPVYGERIVNGFRSWDPSRSKFAALLLKSKEIATKVNLTSKSKVLYLGAATGTTVSHVSDIVSDGLVYAVEFSPRAMRDLIMLCKRRANIIPILADAAKPEYYSLLLEPVDLIYQDVAQRNQAEIATLNCARYLKPGGNLIFMLKTRSIDVTASPQDVYQTEIENLKGLRLIEVLDLLPFHRDHWAILAKK